MKESWDEGRNAGHLITIQVWDARWEGAPGSERITTYSQNIEDALELRERETDVMPLIRKLVSA